MFLAPILALVTVLALGACGGDQPSDDTRTDEAGREYSSADVAFVSEMIQHHADALSMVDLTVDRDLSPEVQSLVDDIRATQGPEIEEMTDLLREWDEPVPETSRDHANAHAEDHGDDERSSELERVPDADFEEVFLEQMIIHHEGAIDMAHTEQEQGTHQRVVELARRIESAQRKEIELMESRL
jgi:uncharacterized protein (DUF305 family)